MDYLNAVKHGTRPSQQTTHTDMDMDKLDNKYTSLTHAATQEYYERINLRAENNKLKSDLLKLRDANSVLTKTIQRVEQANVSHTNKYNNLMEELTTNTNVPCKDRITKIIKRYGQNRSNDSVRNSRFRSIQKAQRDAETLTRKRSALRKQNTQRGVRGVSEPVRRTTPRTPQRIGSASADFGRSRMSTPPLEDSSPNITSIENKANVVAKIKQRQHEKNANVVAEIKYQPHPLTPTIHTNSLQKVTGDGDVHNPKDSYVNRLTAHTANTRKQSNHSPK